MQFQLLIISITSYHIKVTIIRSHMKYYKDKVDYNKFRVFGCLTYFYVPKQFRKKFSNTTLPGIFLGYDEINHTVYKIYDITNNNSFKICSIHRR